jgi:hypothetical protein
MEVPMLIGSRVSRIGWSWLSVLSVLALVGCGGGGGHGGGHISPPANSDASASFAWGIYDVADNVTALTCDQVAGSQFSISLIDRAGNYYDGAGYSLCSSTQDYFNATTFSVPAGYYTVEFYLYGDPSVYAGSNVVIGSYAVDNVYLAPGFTDYRSPPQAVYTESFVVGWTLSSGGRPALCNPGELVEFEFRKPGTNTWIISDFDCTVQTAGTSFPIPVDFRSAEWNLYLLDSTGQTLDAIPGGTVSVPNGADINLGTQTFLVHH